MSKYPIAAELAQEMLALIHERTGIKVNKDEVSYLIIYFQIEIWISVKNVDTFS